MVSQIVFPNMQRNQKLCHHNQLSNFYNFKIISNKWSIFSQIKVIARSFIGQMAHWNGSMNSTKIVWEYSLNFQELLTYGLANAKSKKKLPLNDFEAILIDY